MLQPKQGCASLQVSTLVVHTYADRSEGRAGSILTGALVSPPAAASLIAQR